MARRPRRCGNRGGAWALALVALTLPTAASGQRTGSIEGRIRDDQGAAVYTASVAVTAPDSTRRMAESDALGFFRVTGLGEGTYRVDASRIGHEPAAATVVVRAGAATQVELVLGRAAVAVAGVAVEAERSRARVRFEEVAGRTVQELSVAELKQIPGIAEADLLRAIEVLPGVVSTSDFSSAFHVRGGSADQNLILLDGIPILSPFHLGGFFSVFNADMMARAQLSSGGFPARFGGRVSSLIEIESDPGDGGFRVDGGVSVLAARLAVAGGFGDGLGLANARWRLSARRSYFDALMKPVFDFPYHLTDLQGVFEGWTGGGDRLRVSAYTGADVLDLTNLDPDDFPLRIDWDWGNRLVGGTWSHPRSGGGSFDLTAGWTRYGTELGFPEFGDTRFDSRISEATFRLDLTQLPDDRRKVGLGLAADRFVYRNLFESGGTVFNSARGVGWLLGAYAQSEWTVPRAWVIEAGARLDAWAPDPGDPVVQLAPRIAAKRFLDRGGRVAAKLAVGRYTQFVHSVRDEELPIGLDVWVLSGAQAPSVISDQIQGGIETFLRDDWQLSAEAYWRRFDGVLSFNPAEDPNDDADDMLRGHGTSWGWDLLARRDGPGLSGWVTLSWLKARRTFPDILSPFEPRPEVSFAPVFDRRLDVDLVLRFPVGGGWQGGLRWNFGTGTPYTKALAGYSYFSPRIALENGRLAWAGADDSTDDLGGYAVLLGDRNAERYPAYHRLDVSVRKEYRKSWGHLTPYLDVLNLYNQKNVLFYFYQYSEKPPTRAGISMFPLLPTIGVEAGFR